MLERWWFPRAWDETGLPASRLYFGDTLAFLRYAAALSTGEPFDNGVPFHPPGWPLVLSLLFRLFGWSQDALPDPLILKHVTAVLSGASVALAALLAFRLAGRGAMIATSLLGTFHFGHLVQAAALNSEPLYGLLIIVVLLGASNQRPSLALGILAGLTTIVRVEFGLCALLLGLWISVEHTGEQRRRRAALYLAGFLIALTPTTVSNWHSIADFNRTRADRMPGPLPRFAPVTSYGAFNFANANHDRAKGGFNWDLPSLAPDSADAAADLEAAHLDLARPAVYRAYVDGYRMGISWLAGHPSDAAKLFIRKLAITLSVFDYGYLLDNVPVRLQGTRRPVDQLDLTWSWLTVVHALLAITGLLIVTRSAATRVLLLPVVTLFASASLFFGYVRLGVAYLPVLWILQSLAIMRVVSLLPQRPASARRAEFAAAAAIVLLLVSQQSAADRARVLMIDGLEDENGRLVEDQPMDIVRVR